MTLSSKATIKNYFLTGATPSQQNFADFIDSCLFVSEPSTQVVSGAVSFNGGVNANTISVSGAVTVSGMLAAAGGITVSGASLGTAAFLNVGTGASQVVQLTAASKLPAVDGSLLTNLSTGAMVLLSSAAASGLSTIDVTANIDATYTSYVIIASNLTTSVDNVTLQLLIKSAGSFLTDAHYNYALTYTSEAGSTSGNGTTAGTSLPLTGSALGTSSTLPARFEVGFDQPTLTSQFSLSWRGRLYQGANGWSISGAQGRHTTNAAAVTGMRFQLSSGNLTGTFKLYGIT